MSNTSSIAQGFCLRSWKGLYINSCCHTLRNNGLLSSFQFGFRSKRSTELAVTYFTDIIWKEVDNGNILGAVFIDLSKAFDTVSRSCLLKKLPFYGISNKELHWYTDYYYFLNAISPIQRCFVRCQTSIFWSSTWKYIGTAIVYYPF